MRHAPAVRVEAGPDRLWRAVVSLLAAAAGAAPAAWAMGWRRMPGSSTLAVALAAAVMAVALSRRFIVPAVGILSWDGGRWTWSPAPAAEHDVHPRVTVDLGDWMLLRLAHAGASPVWIALSRGAVGAAWHPFRAAVYSRRLEPAPDSAPRSGNPDKGADESADKSP